MAQVATAIHVWTCHQKSRPKAASLLLTTFVSLLERARRFERPTLTLARLCSTPELRPLPWVSAGYISHARAARGKSHKLPSFFEDRLPKAQRYRALRRPQRCGGNINSASNMPNGRRMIVCGVAASPSAPKTRLASRGRPRRCAAGAPLFWPAQAGAQGRLFGKSADRRYSPGQESICVH